MKTVLLNGEGSYCYDYPRTILTQDEVPDGCFVKQVSEAAYTLLVSQKAQMLADGKLYFPNGRPLPCSAEQYAQYERVAHIVDELIRRTNIGQIVWDYRGPLSCATTTFRGVEYVLDFPRGDPPALAINETCVWRGYELAELLKAVESVQPKPVDQDERMRGVLEGAHNEMVQRRLAEAETTFPDHERK